MQVNHLFLAGLALVLMTLQPSFARQTGTETQVSPDVEKKSSQAQLPTQVPPPPPLPPVRLAPLATKPAVVPPPPPPPPAAKAPAMASALPKPAETSKNSAASAIPVPPPPPPSMAAATPAKAVQGPADKVKPSPVISGGLVFGRDAQGRRTIAVEKSPPPKDARASALPTVNPNEHTYRFALHPTEHGHSFTLEKEKGGTVTQKSYDINWKNILKKPQTPEEKAAQQETKSNLKQLGKSLLGLFGF